MGISTSALAALNVQTFFIPFPEADFQTSLKAINVTGTPVGNSMKTIISMVVPTGGTVVRYDQWEDGYEADLNAPVQSTTQIWGDGNLSNGVAPGYPSDIFPAGATVNLNNNVALPRAASTLFFDGRDRIGCTAAIAVTRAGWGIAPGTVLASATEVYDTRRFGTSYKIPIGITTGSVQNFEYSSLHIIASQANTTVQVDVDGNGSVDQTKVLNMGDSMLVNGGVRAGATVNSTKPVQVHELTGDIGSTYESRTFAIRPTSLWGSSYFAPVGTTLSTEVHTVFLYNPNASAINVSYQTTSSSGTISVPANGNSQFAMPMNSGGHFFTAGGESFYAVGANDSGAAANANQTHDWGYALVPESYLTTGVVVGFGPGSDDLSAPTGPDQNGSPVWITPATSTTIYVNYSGDFTIGASTAPNGAKYDVSYNVNKLQSQTIYDTADKNMTKARIFTTDGAKLAAAWGEDPSKAGPAAPYLDMGTTIVPFPQPALSKTSTLVVDLNSDGKTGVGDTIEYTVRVANEGVVDLDNTIVLDALPNTCTYVANSTKVNGVTITDNSSPSTIFPVDESGYTLYSIPPGGFTLVKYRVTVNPGATSVINNATANGGQAVLTATTTSPIVPAGGNAPTTITFTNSVGTATTSYPQNGNVYVKVTNADLNTNFALAETINVTVTNPTTGDQELITLTETGPGTGVFLNTTALPSSITGGLTQQDNTLYALQGNGLVATFVNTLFGGTFTANAVIETSTLTKKLYLTDTLAMDRVNPAAAPLDTTTAQSSPIGSGSSTIAVDAFTTNSGTGLNTISVTHVTGTGANRLMLVGISKEDDEGTATYSASSVTYGSQSLTKVVERISAVEAECEIWMLVNPASGSETLTVNFTGADSIDSAVVGVATFSGVDQASPLRSNGSNIGASGTATITLASAANDLVFDVLALDDARSASATAGQTSRWSLIEGAAASDGIRAAASTKPGASTVTSSWTVGSDDWAVCAVSIRPAIASSTVSFTQTPTFATAFTMPAGAAPSASVYYTVSSGSMPANPNITAVLKKGTTTIATSNTASASGGLLSFTFPALSSAANFAIGEAATLEITSAQSGVAFTVDYDSTTKPSVVNLPTNTVIVISSFGLYDAPFPGGSLVTSMTNGQRVYARVTAADPFGAYDITGLDLAITDPSNATTTVNLTSTVASTASSKTYEYSWLTGPSDGGYTIQATAKEGSEGITAISSLPLQVASLDLGTPSTTTFTDASGNTVPSYTTAGPVYVQVVDRDQNINTTVAETVTVVVTSSNGDLETITLTETGVNTGIFRSSAITTNTSAVTQGNSALNVVAGATLAANYVDPTDPADTSSASALITSPSSSALSIVKTRILPADGSALPGDPVQFEITVTNAGNTNRSNVTVTDSFPSANLTYVSATPASGGGTSVAPTFTRTWNLGTLTPGQSSTVVVNFTAGAASSSLVTNTASVSSNAGATTAGPSTASLQIGAPGVTVTKSLLTPSAGPVYIGDTIVWRIVVQNSGTTNLTTVPLSDNYSGGALTYVSATVAPDSTGSGSLLWNNIGPIAPAGSKTIDVTMTVKGTSNPTTNTADVSYAVDASGNPVPPSVGSASVQTIGGSIGTTIFKDMNNNGVFDSNEGVQNVYVYSDTNGDGIRQVTEPFGITDFYGAYSIYNLPVALAGTTYNIKVDPTTLPDGLTTVVVDPDATKNGQTSITLTRTALDNTTANFGYRGTASVSDTVWLDVNADGLIDTTDRRLSGVRVFIDQNNNGSVEVNEPSALTDTNGNYLISNLPDGTWTVAIDTSTLPAGVSPTFDLNGIGTPHKTSVVLTPGQARSDVDFGYVGGASIATSIYNDLNGDGSKATTDPGLPGVKVFLDLNANGSHDANEQFATTDSSGNYLISGLIAGTYDVVVDATTLPAGVTVTGDPDVTKDGKTTVSLTASQALITANFGYQGNASIGDHVWNDLNGDGVQDASDLPLSGVRVFIDLNANGTREANEPFATTDASGNYSITGLAAGSYTVAVDATSLPSGVTQTGDPDVTVDNKTAVTLTTGQALTTADFGYQGNASVGDYVWNDANGDGVQDLTELPISGVRVFIDLNANGSRDANEPFATTSASGAYTISGLTPGSYTVAVDATTLPSGTATTGDPDVTKDGKTSVTLAAAVPNTTSDFGYQGDGAISAIVFLDRDASEAQTSGEPGISGVTVFLDYNGDGTRQTNEPQTTTSSTGAYSFSGLIPGNYSVVVVSNSLPAGVTQTADADVTKDNKTTVTVTAGATNTTPNFGYQGNASIGDYVWIDADGNGTQDSTEIPLGGVVVYLDLDSSGTRESNEPFATTNSSGSYAINGLTPGTYLVTVDGSTLPSGSTNTGDPDATKDGKTSVTLASAQSLTTADFGYQGVGSIGSTVWNDLNGDGIQDATEFPISGVKVFIDLNNDGIRDANEPFATTNASGTYAITGLPAGTYQIAVDTPSLPAGVTNTGDPDATKNGRTTVILSSGESNTTTNFGYQGNASIGTTVWLDQNGDGSKSLTEPVLAGVKVFLDRNSDGTRDANEPFATTDLTGNYLISGLIPGAYQVVVDAATLPTGVTNTGDPDTTKDGKTSVTLIAAQNLTTANFGYQGDATVTGHLYTDTNGNGSQDSGEPDLADVDVLITDSLGFTQTVATNASGNWTAMVTPGSTTADVQESDPQYPVGSIQRQGNDPTTFTAVSGTSTDGGIDGYFIPGTITGTVRSDIQNDGTPDLPVSGVTIRLKNSVGTVVATTVSLSDGSYSFIDVAPGSYSIVQTQPVGYLSVSDIDGGNPDIIGNGSPVTVTAGVTTSGQDFLERPQACPNIWADWQTKWNLSPNDQPGDNPDGDMFNNLIEYVFCLPPTKGIKSPFCMAASLTDANKVDAVYTRTAGGALDVTYELQYIADLTSSPTGWTTIPLPPASLSFTYNTNGTETIRISDLESITGLTSGTGFVRLRVSLDANGDSTYEAQATTEVGGWVKSALGTSCRTYNNPFISCPVFSGTIDSVSGNDLVLTSSGGTTDLSTVLVSGSSYFVEITSGLHEGQRFDVTAGAVDSLTLANDASLPSAQLPFNTMLGAPPSTLAGATFAVRKHWTLGTMFPTASFFASDVQTTADQVQVFADGAWTSYWLYDDDLLSTTNTLKWLKIGVANTDDQSAVVIPPGQGTFINCRQVTGSLLAFGKVRENDFVRPVFTGANLVGGGYPLAQSPASRAMTLAGGFDGDRDFKFADMFYVWRGDAVANAAGYDTYYLLEAGTALSPIRRWVKVGDAFIAPRDATNLFLADRAVFLDLNQDLPGQRVAAPWAP